MPLTYEYIIRVEGREGVRHNEYIMRLQALHTNYFRRQSGVSILRKRHVQYGTLKTRKTFYLEITTAFGLVWIVTALALRQTSLLELHKHFNFNNKLVIQRELQLL